MKWILFFVNALLSAISLWILIISGFIFYIRNKTGLITTISEIFETTLNPNEISLYGLIIGLILTVMCAWAWKAIYDMFVRDGEIED